LAAAAITPGAFTVGAFTQAPVSGQAQTHGDRPLGFSAMSMTGKRMFIRDLVANGPAFLVFVRHGDGVSNQFAQQLSRIQKAYGPGKTKWYGILNADPSRANSWIAEFNPSYEVLMDRELSLVQLYGVESAPAVVLIGEDGRIIREWMGYSGYWLKDMNLAIAKAEGVPPKKIDFSMTPSSTRYGARYILKKNSG
jgi:hypothetical protein